MSHPVSSVAAMAKARRVFVCRECGAQFPAWTGQCSSCDAWATVAEGAVEAPRVTRSAVGGSWAAVTSTPLAEVNVDLVPPFPCGVDEVDRVLGGGFVPGSVTLLAGEPGIGKSTLTLQIALSVAATGAGVILVAGEEAPSQVAARAGRLGEIPRTLGVIDETSTDAVCGAIAAAPQLVVVDSIQTLVDREVDSAPGSITQVRSAAARIVEAAKAKNVSVLVIGHVTKDGSIAGPRVLEHVVDTVLSFDGERHGELRFLRAVKHRFGPTNEVGIFEMAARGLATVTDPSQRYLADRHPEVAGSVVVPTLAGRRPVLVEIQALVSPGGPSSGSTTAQGVSSKRLAMVAAVLGGRVGYRMGGAEVFVSAAGGASAVEPGADLAIAVAVASVVDAQPVAADVVACAEIGLGGELRSVPQLENRLQEAYRMGFRTAVVPRSAPAGPTGLRLLRASTLGEALSKIPQQVQN